MTASAPGRNAVMLDFLPASHEATAIAARDRSALEPPTGGRPHG